MGRMVKRPLSRAPWARPGGPAADLTWADAALAALDRPRSGPAQQVRTWNLSSLWRRPVSLVTRSDGKGVMLRWDGQNYSERKVEL